MLRTSTKMAAALGALALCIVGCSSGSSSSSGTSSSTSGSTASSTGAAATGANLTGTPIKIGLVVALEGSEQQQMASVPAVAMAWQSMVNNAGGIAGHPVDIIVKDSQGESANYLTDLKTLVETDKVAAIISSDDTSEAAGGPYLSQNHIPVIGGNGFDTALWGTLPNYYPVTTTIPGTLTGQAVAAKAVAAKSFGTVLCAEVTACLQATALFKPAAASEGLTWTGVVTAAVAAPNYTAQCLSLIQKNTDFISLAVTSVVTQRLVPDCQQQGFKGTFGVNANGYVGSVEAKLTGATLAGNLEAFPWWANAAPVAQFRDAMAKYEPSADYRTGNDTSIWTTLELFKTAIGSPASNVTVTPAMVTTAYGQIKNQTLGGLLPQPITYTPGKPAPLISCGWIWKYTPGQQTNPTILTVGASGNGATGDLQTSCNSAE
jgi:branched-chain amino acid transport system substrate-binding protein